MCNECGRRLMKTAVELFRELIKGASSSMQEKKREMVASAFGEDGSGSHQSRLTLEDLRYLFRV